MNAIIRSAVLLALFIPALCFATTWGEKEVDDPIVPGQKCRVHEPMSYGSYIYDWPSKYDQVFWPLTDPNGIWHCETSGFTAFIGDFKNITPAEREKIAAYLKANYKGPASIEDRLKLLEALYALRQKDAEFNNLLQRMLARWYQELGRLDQSEAYRQKALAGIQQALKGETNEGQKLEYLYVAANYSRLFGDAKASDQYLEELKTAAKHLQDKKLAGFSDYLLQLAAETPRIQPGKIVDPPRTEPKKN